MSLATELIHRWAPIIDRVELVSGRGGIFKVTCDGGVVFDRKVAGRHSNPGEVEERLAELLGPDQEWK